MTATPALTLHHHPHSRSAGARVMLEELGVDYRIELVNLQAGEQRRPEFLALNPLGKLPTLVDGDTVVTEQVAIGSAPPTCCGAPRCHGRPGSAWCRRAR